MKLAWFVSIFAMLIVTSNRSLAGENERFVEFEEYPAKTRTYDLRSVQMVQPGRFTIRSVSVDEGDALRFELKVLDTLRTFCKRPDGNYPAPTDLFTLGPPDLQTKNIEVRSSRTKAGQFKSVSWFYPYKRLAMEDAGDFSQSETYFPCKDGAQPNADEGDLYLKQRRSITNGRQNKELFDCKRGLWGDFVTIEDVPESDRFWPSDPAKVDMREPRPESLLDLWYRGICQRVMHDTPYQSK
jgi:hypothetical protein